MEEEKGSNEKRRDRTGREGSDEKKSEGLAKKGKTTTLGNRKENVNITNYYSTLNKERVKETVACRVK